MEAQQSIEAAVAAASANVRKATIWMRLLKPLLWALSLVYWTVYWSVALYGGTWIVVLALRHAKVLV